MKFVNITRNPQNLRSLQLGQAHETLATEVANPTKTALKDDTYGRTHVTTEKTSKHVLDHGVIKPSSGADLFLGDLERYFS